MQQTRVPPGFIANELESSHVIYITGTNNNRTRIGSLREFCFQAETIHRDHPQLDLPGLSLQLSEMPCGPLYRRHIAPAAELMALVEA